ncbi:FliI/YscN family ATPase [Gynuella sp.]|uniref:FliI/YscN family ATPase n=1 Tax=Gynuella sp. TaxID=2969146 RepID=UPI003D0D983F
MQPFSAQPYISAIQQRPLVRNVGQVTQFFGLILEADGPDVFLGEKCEIYSQASAVPVEAEVIGVRNGRVVLMPYGNIQGVRFGSEVIATGHPVEVHVGEQLLGRVIDSFGNPLDELGDIATTEKYPALGESTNPLKRVSIDSLISTGVKAIDALLPLGRGQRVGLFAGSGVGKSTLLGMLARNIDSDINVIALIGERGREVEEFIRHSLGPEGLARSVVVVETSERSPLLRYHAAHTATSIAEYFRDQGKHVTLMMDSVTRYAMALREIGLSIGEPPTARGYTPSVFTALPRLMERCGCFQQGSISAIYTVLVEGDDMNDPIADAVRAILDGHIVLSRQLAERAHYPAIDVLKSVSRLKNHLFDSEQQTHSAELIRRMALYEHSRDLIEVGAYKEGLNPALDRVIRQWQQIEDFLCQSYETPVPQTDTHTQLKTLVTTDA